MLLIVFLPMPHRAMTPPDFTLQVAVTDETCPGNGQLSISVSGIDPSASMFYKIYKLPDLVNPITEQAAPVIGGLSAGTYRIIAIQTVAGESNSQTLDAEIQNLIQPLAFTISSTGASCQDDGTMTVSVFGGVGVQYEILSGPVTAPLQDSPTFTGLPAGVYQVRVFDNCGEGWVATHTLFSNPGNIETSDAGFEETILPSCNSIWVSNVLTVLEPEAIIYPLSIQYTVYPPDGSAPITLTQNIASGGATELQLIEELPFYNDQQYFYDLLIIDGCGNSFLNQGMLIDLRFVSELRSPPAECGQNFLNVASSNFVPPLNVEFLSVPAGFIPADFNPGHPGPFMDDSIDYGGYTQPVPPGYYSANITDSCGRTVFAEILIELTPAEPAIDITPYPGCDSYMSEVTIRIPNFQVVAATITDGPPEYSPSYPVGVSQLINEDHEVVIPFLPTGTYTIELTDECGNIYIEEFDVPPLATSVVATTRTGCQPGLGAARVRGTGTSLISASITVAPADFGQTLPFDAAGFLSADGILSMASLPPGQYKVTVTDNCGITHTDIPFTVAAYAVTHNTYSITPYCGSFDLTVNHTSNATTPQTFWLQKKTPGGEWAHPQTGVIYPEGSTPNMINSFMIVNNNTNFNISYLGDFRIVKAFQSFGNGNVSLFSDCIEIIQEFTFINSIEIVDIQKTTCNGILSSVMVTPEGIGPFTYLITSMNGQPFLVDNGTNNTFADLAPGVYNFQVIDACANVGNRIADIAELPSLAVAFVPDDMSQCDDGERDGIASFDFTQQTNAVIGGQDPSLFIVTYHASEADAAAGINPLPVPYPTGDTTIFARLEHQLATGCYDVVSFDVAVFDYPLPDIQQHYILCENQTVTLFAPSGFVSYLWSTLETGPAITVDEPGVYTVDVSDGTCSGSAQITVTMSYPPEVDHVETTDWTANDNSITVVLANGSSGKFEFSLDGQNWQDSNHFGGLTPGEYTVFIRDKGRCEVITEEVVLLHYPVFFTPNGDGFNDTWHIPFATLEPNMNIFIFDRYGKLLKNLLPQSDGWDGTYNGNPLPSTDYWFTVRRQDGRLLRGHFAMKR